MSRPGNCNSCPECVYLGEGEFACMAGDEPKIVMSDFFQQIIMGFVQNENLWKLWL